MADAKRQHTALKDTIHPPVNDLPIDTQINPWNNCGENRKMLALTPSLLLSLVFHFFTSLNNLNSPKYHAHYSFHSLALILSDSQMKASWA